ncbi:armadillo-like helical domain-containing protein 4 isoform X2 [Amblyraja radiata]|uniref:armadillo-like helical domain-containing protein 4 isoform X2 n=1 Tax=Amblyraja radiata TaxID=386614 RepID=UPI001402BD2B|nr:armadillo-like helical domain-containing protein 4 isoform X2 [Amblyraja radiata]
MMRSTEFYTVLLTLVILIRMPELQCSTIRQHHRRNIPMLVSTEKLEDIKSHHEGSDTVTTATVISGEIVSPTAPSSSSSSLETLTARLNTSIVEETLQTSKNKNENVITLSSLDTLLTTTTIVPLQKQLNVTAKTENVNKTPQTEKNLTPNSTSKHAADISDVDTTTGVTLNETATLDKGKIGGMENNEQMTEQVTISTLLSLITKTGDSGEATGTTYSSSETFTANSHDTTALPLSGKTIETISTSKKDIPALTSEMLNFTEFTIANVENLRNEEVTPATIEPAGGSFSWKYNSPSAGRAMSEIMATTGSAITDSKAPNTFQVTTTSGVTTAIEEDAITEMVPSISTETAQTMLVTSTVAIIGTTNQIHKGWSERLAMTNETPAVKSALSTTPPSEKQVLEANTNSTKEMPPIIPTEVVQHAIASGTKITKTATAGTTTLQTISRKTKKTSAAASVPTDITLLHILTTPGPSVEATVPPSSSGEKLESEAEASATALPRQKSADLITKNVSAATARLSTESSHATLQTSATKTMGVTKAAPSISVPVLRDNMLSTLGVTTSPSIRQSEPPTYMLDTTESEEEDDDEEEEEDDEDEDEDIDLDEDSMDYDTEVPSLSYITPGGPIRGNRNLTKLMEMSYQLPDSFEWNQHDQVRSWLEKIKNKAGYMSGMLMPVAVGVAGALFILGALYSLKVMNRKRKNVFKRRETKPRDFTSMQDRVMLLADSSEDEF